MNIYESQVCRWEEELKEKIFPEHDITLSDRLATKEPEIVEMNTIHNFNNCSNNNCSINNNNNCSNDDNIGNIVGNNKNNSSSAGVFPCDGLNLNRTDECRGGEVGSTVQRIIDHMGKAVLQLALSDEEKQVL